jgi:hypothetical protein
MYFMLHRNIKHMLIESFEQQHMSNVFQFPILSAGEACGRLLWRPDSQMVECIRKVASEAPLVWHTGHRSHSTAQELCGHSWCIEVDVLLICEVKQTTASQCERQKVIFGHVSLECSSENVNFQEEANIHYLSGFSSFCGESVKYSVWKIL